MNEDKFQTVSTQLQVGPPELDLINGTGSGTSIGKSTFVVNAQFTNTFTLTKTITVTTETGENFFVSIAGHDPQVDDKGAITLNFQGTIIGGTGKYIGATGTFAGITHESIYSPSGSAVWDGTIVY